VNQLQTIGQQTVEDQAQDRVGWPPPDLHQVQGRGWPGRSSAVRRRNPLPAGRKAPAGRSQMGA